MLKGVEKKRLMTPEMNPALSSSKLERTTDPLVGAGYGYGLGEGIFSSLA